MGHSSKFQRLLRLAFVTAATLLTGGQPHFARCLAVSCAATLHIYFLGLLPPDRILPVAKFTLRPSLALSYIGITAWYSSSGRQPNFAALNRGRHLYSAGRPSGWAFAHISSLIIFLSPAKIEPEPFVCDPVTHSHHRVTYRRANRKF